MNNDLNINIALPASAPRKGGFVHLVLADGVTHQPALIGEVHNDGTCDIIIQGNATTPNKTQQATHDEQTKPALTWHWPD